MLDHLWKDEEHGFNKTLHGLARLNLLRALPPLSSDEQNYIQGCKERQAEVISRGLDLGNLGYWAAFKRNFPEDLPAINPEQLRNAIEELRDSSPMSHSEALVDLENTFDIAVLLSDGFKVTDSETRLIMPDEKIKSTYHTPLPDVIKYRK